MSEIQAYEEAELFRSAVERVQEEVRKVIVGMDQVLHQVATAFFAGGHVLLEGAPGLGKTLLVKVFSQALGLDSRRIQFTPDLMPADILGSHVLVEDGRPRVEFVKGPVFTNVLLADEINRCTPKTQAALLEAMQEQAVTIGGERMALEKPFFTIATQNPIEMEGTYPLPEAQLDRFFFKVIVLPPELAELREIGRRTTGAELPVPGAVMSRDQVCRMQELVRQVPVPEVVEEYAARLVLATHPGREQAPPMAREFVRYGASPRGLQALLLGARIEALLDGRYSVSSRDIIAVVKPALRHRLILGFEAEAMGISTEQIIDQVVESIKMPGGS